VARITVADCTCQDLEAHRARCLKPASRPHGAWWKCLETIEAETDLHRARARGKLALAGLTYAGLAAGDTASRPDRWFERDNPVLWRDRAFRFYVTFRVKCITFEAVSDGSQNEHHAFIKSLRFSKASPRR
jgi:hypothetical protein